MATDTKPQTRGTTPARSETGRASAASEGTTEVRPQGASGGGVAVPAPNEKKKRVNRDPLHPFQGEIMQKVIKPKIAELLASSAGMDDVALHTRFKKETGSCVALNRFRNWMKACGFVQSWITTG